ncbi:MAG: L,D-transpeptidase family protein [Eubacteriales bacterium]|nr:L,D-transpeptidase family protein [Eubacteriales bacterium]
MKRNRAAMILSLTLSVTMAGEAGAAALLDGDLLTSEEVQITEAAPEVEEIREEIPETGTYADAGELIVENSEGAYDNGESLLLPDTQPAAEDGGGYALEDELTSGGDETSQVGPTPVETTPEPAQTTLAPETEDAVEDEISVSVGADGTVTVSASAWVKVSQGFKLIKTTGKSVPAVGEVTTFEIPVLEAQEEILPETVSAELTEEPATEEPVVQEAPAIEVPQVSETVPETPAQEIVNPAETPAEEPAETPSEDPVEPGEAPETEAGPKTFFTAADGIVKVKTRSTNGSEHVGFYKFDANGILITSRTSVASGTHGYNGSEGTQMYFTSDNEAVFYSGYENNLVKTPATSTLGQRKTNFWLYENQRFYYFDEAGVYLNPTQAMARFSNGIMLNINGKYYSLLSSGRPRTGLVTYQNEKYYFDPNSEIPGENVRSRWESFTTEKGTKWLFFRGGTGKALKYTGYYIAKIDGKNFHILDHNGYLQKNKIATVQNGKKYGSDSNGKIYKDRLVKFGNYRYYFTSSGTLATYKNGWVRLGANTGKRYYYFGGTAGRVVEQKGIKKVTDNSGNYVGYYYFPESGNHYKDRFSGKRYFTPEGKMASGRTTVRGKQYFFEISTASSCKGNMYKGTMIRYNNRWFYAQSNGELFKQGWITINKNLYHFWSYSPQTCTFKWHGDTYGYLDYTGKFGTGWLIYNNTENKVRYVDPSGNGFYKNTNVVIDGLRYYFDADGFRINDLTNIYTSGYYVEVDRVNGVCTVYNSSRTVPVKSIRVSVGAAGTETPLGTYYLRASGRWQLLMGPSYGQYGTNVVGAGAGGIFFHSIPCPSPSVYAVPSLPYSILGYPASHGCIRCCVADAKFIFERCNGATVRIFDGVYNNNEARKGPLGRNKLIPMTGNFDPTDPTV